MTTKTGSRDLIKRSGLRDQPEARSLRVPNLFGSALRAELLALLAGLGRSYPRELARIVEKPISLVQRAIADLELAGVLVTRISGRQREVSLNPDYVVAKELAVLLNALLEREPRYRKRLSEVARRRPRRTGKPL